MQWLTTADRVVSADERPAAVYRYRARHRLSATPISIQRVRDRNGLMAAGLDARFSETSKNFNIGRIASPKALRSINYLI
jgi:hypothetical protein